MTPRLHVVPPTTDSQPTAVLHHPRLRAWPLHADGGHIEYMPIATALARRYPTDAHTTAYSVSSVPRRLSRDAATQIEGGVTMALAIFDIDGPDHQATDAWWAAELDKLCDLLAAHAGYVYRTRGGYRIVYRLARPIYIRDASDATAWSALYRAWCGYLARRYGIAADIACADWQRLYRLPHATRDEGGAPEELEVLGDPDAIGTWSPELTTEDMADDDRAPAGAGDRARGRGRLVDAFGARGWLGAEIEPGKWAARCPFAEAHTSGDGTDGSTVVYAAAPGRDLGWWHCSHGHCAERGADDVLAALGIERQRPYGSGGDDYTDSANGRRYAEMHGDTYRYVADRGMWRRWDGRRWADALDGELIRGGQAVAKKMRADAGRLANPEHAEAAFRFAVRSSNADKLKAMIKMASSELVLETRSAQYDSHLDLLTVDNGTLDLRTGELHQHARDELITTYTPIKYDGTAECPRWQQFLCEVFAGDEELIRFVQRAVGYSLTGHTSEHAFFLLYGNGKNGKGRFVRQLMALLGDAARTTAFDTFTTTGKSGGEHNTPGLAALAGARLVCAGEPDEGVRLSESVIKALTGEDEISACRKYENPFTFTPRFKIWLHTNHKPEIRGTDNGIWRRPRLIPFVVSFEGRADLQLDTKLDGEREGILAWAVAGASKWYREGLGTCAPVADATATYREESDPLGAFIEDCIISRAGGFVATRDLERVYARWCQANGLDPWRTQTMIKALCARGYRRGRQGGDRGIADVQVLL